MNRVISFALALLAASSSFGQVNKSNLTGVVRDGTGAAVAGASVKIQNTGTGAVRQETTDATGLYRLSQLDHGVYRIDVEMQGFKRFVQENVQLVTGETITIDIALELGALSESVTITGEAALLRTETGSVGTTVNRQIVNELPLIGRNPYVFLVLSPGIQYTGSPTAINPWDTFGPSDFSSSGSEARSEFLLDGMPNMRLETVAFSPSPDAVEEMRVQTNAYDAEYGHSGASFVNVSTKSGANAVHGALYWYHRNDNLNANSFFNNRNARPKGERKQNTYGFAISGPVYLPKFFNGKDKTHFFADYEGTKIRSAGFARAIVPTALERQGDFSATADRFGRPFTIYDPATTRAEGNGFVRAPFAGNRIPTARFDRVAQAAIKFYPEPNKPQTVNDLQNFERQQPSALEWGSFTARVDHRLSSSHNLFFRFGWNQRDDPSTPFYGECCRPAGNPTSGQDEFERGNEAGGFGYTWIASARTVIDFRLGVNRYTSANIMYGEGFDAKTLGFPATFADAVNFRTFPRFETSGDVENLGAGRTTSREVNNQYNPLVNVHTTLGRHALKYGFRYQIGQLNGFGAGRSGGLFRMDRRFTQGPDPTRTTLNSGHDFASMLLGTPSSGFVDQNASRALQNAYWATYIQNDWKTTDRLTLNVGLRLEHETAPTERFDRGSGGLDTSVASPVEAGAKANYARNPIPELRELNAKGGLGFLNAGGAPRSALDMPTIIWAPRIGAAYRITNRLVWRGGTGLFYIPNNVNNYRQDGFSLATQMVASLDGGITPFHTLSNPYPNGLNQPPGASGGLLTGVGQSLTAGVSPLAGVPPYLHGLSHQFSSGFQVVLPGEISLEANYVGNISQRMTLTRRINDYPNEFLALRTRLNARVANPFAGVITNPTSALSQPTTTVQQLLRPFPHFIGLTQAVLPYGRSHYDSLQVQGSKRLRNGMTLGGSYTLSKFMESTSYLNNNDAKPEKVISNSDRPQRLVLYGSYELPFGQGRALFNGTNPVVKRVVGGWQMNWVITYQSMDPLAFGGAERVSRSANNPRTVDEWFDVRQFVPQEPFTMRQLSTRVADLRAQGIRRWDFSVLKNTIVTERMRMQLRGEFYNLFNTTHFAAPNTTVTNASFGRITGTFLGPREIQAALRLEF
jgi:hypothetical protein